MQQYKYIMAGEMESLTSQPEKQVSFVRFFCVVYIVESLKMYFVE